MGGVGAAAGPLIGGLITSAISWRAAFVFQALVIAVIVLLSRRIDDPLPADPTRPFDTRGAVLSAVGLVLVVMGILAADNNLWLMLGLIVAGALVLAVVLPARCAPRSAPARSRCCRRRCSATAPPTSASSPRTPSGCCSWGSSFVVAAYLQVVRGYDAIQTGVIFTAATVGLLAVVARRRAPRAGGAPSGR